MSAAPPPRDYDQILSGDIKIKKVKSDEYTHKIIFSKKNISKVLMYQVWSDTSVDLNKDRIVKEVKATSWVKSAFRKVETGTVPSIPFTPTTVMELDDGECPYHHKAKNCNEKDECRHVFVIKRALVNKCGQVVFYVSSKDIVLPSNPNKEVKRLKTIPTGSFYRTRFDIDAVSKTVEPICENGEYNKVNDLIDIQFSGYDKDIIFIQKNLFYSNIQLLYFLFYRIIMFYSKLNRLSIRNLVDFRFHIKIFIISIILLNHMTELKQCHIVIYNHNRILILIRY